ncbi:hypothetical protein [Mycolicibacterium fortuitum]|uniref:Uncharacterized protein n=2 Tax=Mycolicibacterium fortuitum TaxID=1766 RepID=A0A0N9Y1N8_MYCFO|nr:hypothetical protein [Mycolicibacterium fortuitum]AJR30088.1 hypothetical protein G155_14090 [Mycobacterium sp. VKM Ac-1817D]CRL69583.1 hypothetical protein CPGR_00282 [Mycolicibacter nonchromogenicus]ALI26748.1 hypothetical protein XA26_29130 [Mycolicibacterium fortuitum]EJZ15359.1 hypothetical protein MFORT_05233 [Mycolicibacterium fortuitum subsp. fortuitum DSM 46621 = ATCC 6841 = JCM 6387]MCA4751825.1 hypothetical protein [Mycolicibacterium fortuitum]
MSGYQPGGIAVTARYWRGAAPFGRREPQFTLNGNVVPSAGWGRTVLPVLPGRHFLHVEIPAKGRFGSARGLADTVIDVYPGRMIELEYRAPLAEPIVRGVSSPRGALGPAPQQYNGVANLVLAWGMLLLLGMVFGMPAVFWLLERLL